MSVNLTYAQLRRTLAQRLNFWGGDISNNGSGAVSATGSTTTMVDTTRAEPDDEWNEAWIVLNPGSTNQVTLPTIWRRVAIDAGWVQSTGVFTIQGSWPAPYNSSGPGAGVAYEVYKVFRPENWLQAINWALTNSYPERHVAASFEVPQNPYSRIIKWGELVKSLSVTDPVTAPTVTEIADGKGAFQPGVYTFAYSYYNDIGETLTSSVATVTFNSVNSNAKFNALTSVPATVTGANYYCSIEAADTQLGLLPTGSGTLTGTIPVGAQLGINENGTIPQVQFPDPFVGVNSFPSSYNTTNLSATDLFHVLQRVNPGSYPEIWNDLGADLYKPMGGQTIMLMYNPSSFSNLKFICIGSLPTISKEVDITFEPPELLYAGAEAYLWNLLVKTSTITGSSWEMLAKKAMADFEQFKKDYSLDLPRSTAFRPQIKVVY